VYRGCFPSDGLPHPRSLKYPSAFVVNLDPHEMEGSHWITVYAYGLDRDIIYYDSLAFPISPIIEETFLSQFPKTQRNVIPYQNPNSKTCAHHCITLIYFLSQGQLFPKFLKLLNTKYNPDFYVKSIVKEIIK
jgi:hypothetical protein